MDLPEMLKKLRIRRNMTQRDLSEITGISLGMIGHYETGFRSPRIKNIQRLALALGVDPMELLEAKFEDILRREVF